MHSSSLAHLLRRRSAGFPSALVVAAAPQKERLSQIKAGAVVDPFSNNPKTTIATVIGILLVLAGTGTYPESLKEDSGVVYGVVVLFLVGLLGLNRHKEFKASQLADQQRAQNHPPATPPVVPVAPPVRDTIPAAPPAAATTVPAPVPTTPIRSQDALQLAKERQALDNKALALQARADEIQERSNAVTTLIHQLRGCDTWLEFPDLVAESLPGSDLAVTQAAEQAAIQAKITAMGANQGSVREIIIYLHEQEGGFALQVKATEQGVDLPQAFKTESAFPMRVPGYTVNGILTTQFYEEFFKTVLFFEGVGYVCTIPYHAIVPQSIQPLPITEEDKRKIAAKRQRFAKTTFVWKQTDKGVIMLVKFRDNTAYPYALFLAEPGLPDREIVLVGNACKALFDLLKEEFGK